MDDARPASGGEPGPHQEVAAHFDRHLPRILASVRPALGGSGPIQYLGQCSDGVVDFTLDVLDAIPPAAGPKQPANEARATLRGIGEQLSLSAAQLDRRLTPLRSGNLIRLVLQAAGGAFYCDSVVPGQYVVGVRLPDQVDVPPDGRAADDSGDREMSRIVTELRRLVSLPSLNPGGFEISDKPPAVRPLDPAHYRLSGDSHDPRLPACREALTVDSVQYLALWAHGKLRFAVDILEHDDLDEYFTLIDIDTRRRLYREVGGELLGLVGGFGRILHAIANDPPTRVVLDVEQGALYYARIRRGEYLVGVSLVQRRVEVADVVVGRVADRLRDSASERAAA